MKSKPTHMSAAALKEFRIGVRTQVAEHNATITQLCADAGKPRLAVSYTARKLEVVDARALELLKPTNELQALILDDLAKQLEVEKDEAAVACRHLHEMNCIAIGSSNRGAKYSISAFGREFLRAVEP